MTSMLKADAVLQGNQALSSRVGMHLVTEPSRSRQIQRTEAALGNPDTFGKPGFCW